MRMTVVFALFVSCAFAADWKPADVPISTRWAKEVSPDKVWPEYPRPQMVRKDNWTNLNGLWDYTITAKEAARPEKWDGKILVPFCVESSLGGVGKRVSPDQAVWYRRSFKKPDLKGGRLLLHFGAVDWHCKVTVNGKQVGEHKGCFDPFTIDITDALKDGDQELIVWVWDPTDAGSQPIGKQLRNPHGIWYTPVTGIWQTVWLEVVPKTYIEKVRFVPNLDKSEVECRVDVVGNADSVLVGIKGDGGGLKIIGNGKPGQSFRFKVADPKVWSPDNPHLHEVEVGITGPVSYSNFTDIVSTYFAMRKISVGNDDKGIPRLMLNNKPLFQLGPLDQGWWPDGLYTPPTEEAMVYDLKVLKELGMNMLRKHIKVEPARLYYHCDKLGLLVWQDMPSAISRAPGKKHFIRPDAKEDAVFTADEKAIFRKELKAMIDHLSFFPCIVCWVPFNEGWGQHDTNEILKWTMMYDPTRLVDGPSGWTDRGVGHLKDLHRYPGPDMFPVMKDRVSVLGEFGGLGLPIEGHLWRDSKNWGYRTYKTKEELQANYRRLMLQLHPLIEKGLAAAVYTQTTDVEIEVNGYLTYDRAVLKFDPKETAKWHKALFGPLPEWKVVVPTSEKEAQKWRYVTATPQAAWMKPEFDDSKWKEGEGGFGTAMTPGTVVRTEWNTNDIWLRRTVELKDVPVGELFLRIHHDEDYEIYINGVLAGKGNGFVTNYGLASMTAEGRKALKVGKNTIAVHCKQTGGGQYIDVGIVELVEKK